MQFATLANGVANFAAFNADVQNFLKPIMISLIGLAGLVATFFIITAGIEYMTSNGRPDRLEHAKKVLKGALIGLVLVIAAASITAILSNSYGNANENTAKNLPAVQTVETEEDGAGITEVLLKAIVGLFRKIIETAAIPFISALEFFTKSTPLMADNASVFKLWLTVVGIANALFVLVVAIIGFQFMSASALGFDELDLRQLLPRLAFTFLLMNTSIFFIDFVISISNAMITALTNAYGQLSVFEALQAVTKNPDLYGIVSLLIMVAFLTLAVMLLVYYVLRIVTLYVGAVLSPLIALLGLLPGFRDFSLTATKTYFTTVFVLFVHVVILLLSATLFEAIRNGEADQPYDPIMAMIVGIASLIALLKTQGLMMQLSYVSAGPRALRRLGTQFMNGVNYTTDKVKTSRTVKTKGYK